MLPDVLRCPAGRFATQQEAREACRATVADFEAEDQERLATRAADLQEALAKKERARAAVQELQARHNERSRALAVAAAEQARLEAGDATGADGKGSSVEELMRWARGEKEGVPPPANSRELALEGGVGSGKWIQWDTLPFPLGTLGKPTGLRMTRATGRWLPSLTVMKEIVHLGTPCLSAPAPAATSCRPPLYWFIVAPDSGVPPARPCQPSTHTRDALPPPPRSAQARTTMETWRLTCANVPSS